ncbi:hypothetical protein B0H19DRAFT_1244108 [Mycena capillaripes]|nr:hypothetical protein B0H19DRAFT_1244108 [Mycena capillaripes]
MDRGTARHRINIVSKRLVSVTRRLRVRFKGGGLPATKLEMQTRRGANADEKEEVWGEDGQEKDIRGVRGKSTKRKKEQHRNTPLWALLTTSTSFYSSVSRPLDRFMKGRPILLPVRPHPLHATRFWRTYLSPCILGSGSVHGQSESRRWSPRKLSITSWSAGEWEVAIVEWRQYKVQWGWRRGSGGERKSRELTEGTRTHVTELLGICRTYYPTHCTRQTVFAPNVQCLKIDVPSEACISSFSRDLIQTSNSSSSASFSTSSYLLAYFEL